MQLFSSLTSGDHTSFMVYQTLIVVVLLCTIFAVLQRKNNEQRKEFSGKQTQNVTTTSPEAAKQEVVPSLQRNTTIDSPRFQSFCFPSQISPLSQRNQGSESSGDSGSISNRRKSSVSGSGEEFGIDATIERAQLYSKINRLENALKNYAKIALQNRDKIQIQEKESKDAKEPLLTTQISPEATVTPIASTTLPDNSLRDIENHNDVFADVETAPSVASSFGEEERKLKDFQHTLDMICQSSMDPVVIIDEAGRIKSVNQEFLSLFEFDLWEVVGRNVNMLMPKEYSVHHNKFLERYRLTKMRRIIGQVRTNIHGMKKNGVRISIRLKVQVITDIHGTVYTGVIKDVGRDEELIKIRNMLSHMLPKGYEEKITTGKMIAENFPNGSVLFVDLVDFTKFASTAEPWEIITTLNEIFEQFDSIIKPMDVEKIKTIGDCFMAAAGVTKTMYDAPIRILEAALQILDCISKNQNFKVRAGVATGKIISGVLKGEKLSFDIWGDTVNVAARMQSLAPVDAIRVCYNTHRQTKFMYDYHSCEELEVKGKGSLKTFIVKGRKQQLQAPAL